MAETPEQRLERVARALCEARGIEPDALVAYDNGTMAYTRTHAWRLAAHELKAAKLLADHVAMLASDGVMASRMTEDEIHARDWWCPHCLKDVPPEMVTKDGEHYLEAGGCGYAARGELKDVDGVKVCRAEQRGASEWVCDCAAPGPNCKPTGWRAPGVAGTQTDEIASGAHAPGNAGEPESRMAFCPACFVEVTQEQADAQTNAARVLAEFARTAPGRLPSRVQEALAVVEGASGVMVCATEQDCTGMPWCRINGKCQRTAGVDGKTNG